jgi:hypothetical protein
MTENMNSLCTNYLTIKPRKTKPLCGSLVCRSSPTFKRNILPPSSRSKSKPSEQEASSQKIVGLHVIIRIRDSSVDIVTTVEDGDWDSILRGKDPSVFLKKHCFYV